MSVNLEFEAKSMLSKQDYEKLAKEFSNPQKYIQTNYYISAKNLSKDVGIRIRKKYKDFELTIKVNLGDHKKEINQKISRKSLIFFRIFRIFPKGEVFSYLIQNRVENLKNLHIIGKMKTTRIDVNFDTSLISIDKSQYNKLVDYEIECEDSSFPIAETQLIKFLETRNIEYKKSKYSKLARFINSK